MRTDEFKRQAKAQGLIVKKQYKLEIFDVLHESDWLFSVTFAELYSLSTIGDVFAKKLRPEYIPPLG